MSDNSEIPTEANEYDLALYQGFIAETVAFVLYCALFIFTMIKWRKVSQNMPLFVLTILLFISCAAHFGTTVYPIYLQNIPVNGLMGLSFMAGNDSILASAVFFALANVFGDVTMIFRLYKFYQGNYIYVAIPTLLSIAGFVLYIANALLLIENSAALSPTESLKLVIASYVCPLLTNLIVTALIIYRTMSMVRRQNDETMSTPARRAIATIIESGVLYFLMQLLATIANGLSIAAATPITFFAVQIYGIAPTLITAGINSGVLLANGGVPSVTGPLATTRIAVDKDSYVMTHLSETKTWSEFDRESKESITPGGDSKSIASSSGAGVPIEKS